MQDDQYESAVGQVAPVVWALAALVFGVEVWLMFGENGLGGGADAFGRRQRLFSDWAFSPAVWDYAVQGQWSVDLLKRFVTYLFLQGGFTDALFGAALLLALGKFVGDVFHWAAVLAVFLGSGIFGAVVFGIALDGTIPLIGVWPAVYGLIGAFTYITWHQLGQSGQNQLMAFRLIAFLLALQLVFAVIFSGDGNFLLRLAMALPEISGFMFGLVISPFIAPGGWSAFLARMRR